MNKVVVAMMALSGLVLGFFIAFSREPVAGAAIGAIASVLTAVGLFFLQLKDGVAKNARLAGTLSAAMTSFYFCLVSSTAVFILALPLLPSNLDMKRDTIASFLTRSGLTSIEVSATRYQLPGQAQTAAAALLLASDALVSEATGLRVLGVGDVGNSANGVSASEGYCRLLRTVVQSAAPDTETLAELEMQSNEKSARLAARLLLGFEDPEKLKQAAADVASQFCGTEGKADEQ